MLQTIIPFSDISIAFRTSKYTMSMLFILIEVTFILTAIFPYLFPTSMFLKVYPLPLIFISAFFEDALAFYYVFIPITYILRIICIYFVTFSMFFTINELTCIDGPVGRGFFPVAIFMIIRPLTFVRGTVIRSINSLPMQLVMKPFTTIYITFNMLKCSMTTRFIILPISLISTICPILYTVSMP